jgi:hypothetical protein
MNEEGESEDEGVEVGKNGMKCGGTFPFLPSCVIWPRRKSFWENKYC